MQFKVYENIEQCESEICHFNNKINNNNPFLSFDWLKLWWDHFGEGKFLYIILFHNKGELVGFAPFYRVYRRSLRLYEYHMIGENFSSYIDIACTAGYEEMVVDSLFEHFKSISPGLIVHFKDINDRFSRCFLPLSNYLKKTDLKSSCVKLYPCPLVFLGDSWNDFFKQRRGGKSRKNLRRKNERLSGMGDFRFCQITNHAEVPDLFSQLEHIHTERFSETINPVFRGKSGTFLKSALQVMLNNHMPLIISEIDGVPISFLIGFKMGEFFIAYIMAFDPVFSLLSLGDLQIIYTMENLINEGFKYFDFSKGEAEYKRYWSNDETTSYFFKFGFNLNMFGFCYSKAFDAMLNIKLRLRTKGYNTKIKQWLATLRQGNIFEFHNKKIYVKEIRLPSDIDITKLPQFSYDKIRCLSVKVREQIIKCGFKSNLGSMRFCHFPDERNILLSSDNRDEGYLISY